MIDNQPQFMSNSLWGICLKPGDSYTFKGQGLLQLQQCNLSAEPSKGRSRLEVHAKGHTYTLCTLAPNKLECQPLSQVLIAEDRATLKVKGANEIHVMGTLTEYDVSDDEALAQPQLSYDNDDEEEEEDEETVTGYPIYPSYLSDLLGPDLPDEDEEDEEDSFYTDQEISDAYGTISFRDVNDNSLIGGFELRHFNLAPNFPGFEEVDLRAQEDSMEDSLLNDSIATGLINSLLNSGDQTQIQQGQELRKRLNHFCKRRKEGKALHVVEKKKMKHQHHKKEKEMKKKKKKLGKTLKMMEKQKL